MASYCLICGLPSRVVGIRGCKKVGKPPDGRCPVVISIERTNTAKILCGHAEFISPSGGEVGGHKGITSPDSSDEIAPGGSIIGGKLD